MFIQTFIAYFIVALALAYAGWMFMPQGARRWLIGRVIAVMPSSQRARFARLQSGVEIAGCNSCKGCEADVPAGTTVKTIQLRRR